jgi:hypothetical protein
VWKVFFVNRTEVRRAKARFDRVPVVQDIDMALQLLKAGVQTIALTRVSFNASGEGIPGGCTVYRTDALRVKTFRQMKKLHPGICDLGYKEKGGRTMPFIRVKYAEARRIGNLPSRRR